MNIDIVKPIITIELSFDEAREFLSGNRENHKIPDISLNMAALIRQKLVDLKQEM